MNYKEIFLSVFSGVSGYLAVYFLVGLYALTFFGVGYYLIMTYNKKGTKVFKDMQPMQYLGVIFCILGMLPFAQYFFFGFMSEAGASLMDNMFQN